MNPTRVRRWLDDRYGTWRGLVRVWLGGLELRTSRLSRFRYPDLARCERLVWVCLGNVCRSPYAQLAAEERNIPGVSCGLSTGSGQPANPSAIAAAARAGRDLRHHRATAWSDFVPQPNDLYVVMEIRQARELRRRLKDPTAQITLLGLWTRPRRVHLHDPMTLGDGYFDTCFRLIDSGVAGLIAAWNRARGG